MQNAINEINSLYERRGKEGQGSKLSQMASYGCMGIFLYWKKKSLG